MPRTDGAPIDELGSKYDVLFGLIRHEFPYGSPVDLDLSAGAPVVKDGWLKDHNLVNPKFVLEEEAQEEGDSTSLHWEFNGETDESGRPLRVTKALKVVYQYQRPIPQKGPDGKPLTGPDGKWLVETVGGVPQLETVESSILVGYRGPDH